VRGRGTDALSRSLRWPCRPDEYAAFSAIHWRRGSSPRSASAPKASQRSCAKTASLVGEERRSPGVCRTTDLDIAAHAPRCSGGLWMKGAGTAAQRSRAASDLCLPPQSVLHSAGRYTGLGHDRREQERHSSLAKEGLEGGPAKPESLSSLFVFCVSVERPTTAKGDTDDKAAYCFQSEERE